MVQLPKRSIAFEGVTQREAHALREEMLNEAERHESGGGGHLHVGRAVEGNCGSTPEREGDCSRGASGSWRLALFERDSWRHATRACARHCQACQQCHNFSVSLTHADCSWYAQCPRLHATPVGFRSHGRPVLVIDGAHGGEKGEGQSEVPLLGPS